MKNTNLLTLLTKFLVIILPFYVIIKVFFEVKLWVPIFGFFIKEFVIIVLFLSLIYEYYKAKQLPKFELLDYLIFSYFAYWIIITLINWLSFEHIFYGWRYDFIFLVVFLIFRHAKQFIQTSISNLIKLFLISSTISLLLWLLVKFILWEEFLEYFWYSIYVADWQFKWWIPIYHGVEASGIRRFQGLLDSPNSMWFFLLMYAWVFMHYFRKKIEYHIVLVFIWIFILILLTYSRSALLWFLVATWWLLALNLKYIFKKYKKETVSILLFLFIFSWFFYILFQDKINNIFIRPWSTTWHFDRMEIWIEKFLEHPFWYGLATSGPWFRSVYTWEITKEVEQGFIPESWFIQQLVEWGFIYFTLFISILTIILLHTYKKSKPIFWSLVAILIMNVLLHTFEATYLSILFFIFLWLFNSQNNLKLEEK